jgi:hypothetical protein
MLLLGIEKKNIYKPTRHEDKSSGFLLITMALYNFSRCNAKYTV